MGWLGRALSRIWVLLAVGLLAPCAALAASSPTGLVTGPKATVVAPTGPPPAKLPTVGQQSPKSLVSGALVQGSGPKIAKYTSATADTYALSNGSFDTKLFAEPVNYRNASGQWTPIDNSWTADTGAGGGAVQNGANSWHVKLPGDLRSSDVSVADDGLSFGFGISNALPSAVSISGSHASYRGAFKDATVQYESQPESVKESIVLSSAAAPTSYSFPLDMPSGWTPKLVNGNVEFFNAAGDKAKVAIAAPEVTDATDSLGGPLGPLTTTLDHTATGWVLNVQISQAWLDSSKRVFPVTLDPTLDMNGSQTDCMIINNTLANDSFCDTGYLDVGTSGGYDYNDLLNFGTIPLPQDAQITTAAVALDFGSSSSGVANVAAYPLKDAWNTNATWNSSGEGVSWEGGLTAFYGPQDTESVPAAGGYVNWYVTQIVQDWVDGSVTNNGLELGNDSDSTLAAAYAYASGENVPSLNIDWTPRIGSPTASPMVNVPMGDGIGLSVNAANGNAETSFPMFNIDGTGLNFGLGAHNSSLGSTSATLGEYAGARMNFLPGPAMQLFAAAVGGGGSSAESPPYAIGPDDVPYAFVEDSNTVYYSPGLDATLIYSALGNSYAWIMTMDDTGESYVFGGQVGSATYGLMLFDENRDGAAITYNWSIDAQGGAYLSSIVDTQGRTITPTYNGPDGAVSSWEDSTGRTVSFGYNSAGEVTSITDPMNHVINLGYSSSGQISQITDPDGDQTDLNYDSSDRVTSVVRVSNTSAGTGPTYSFNYQAPSGVCSSSYVPAQNGTGILPVTSETVYTDPDGNNTTFCDDYFDRNVLTQDAAGNMVTTGYNPDNAPDLTTLMNSSGAVVSTELDNYLTYDGAPTQTATSDEISGGSTAVSGSATYNSAAPNQLLPDSTTDPQGNATHYTYNANGDTLTVLDPWTNPNSGGAADNTINLSYEPGHPGWLATSATPDGATTSYSYDAEGNLTSESAPAAGQQTFGYDGLSRQTCSTDGVENMTVTAYNADDELTSTSYLGNTGTNCLNAQHPTTATGQVTDTNTYDNDGNLTNEVDGSEIASAVFNNLGEMTSQVLPTGQSVSYTYDADGNIQTFTDGAGEYVYHYNNLEQLDRITEPNGKITTFGYNPEGQRDQIVYPNGITVNYTWDATGRLTKIIVDEGTTQLGEYDYSYVNGNNGSGSGTLISQLSAAVGGTDLLTTYGYDDLNRLLTAITKNGSTTQNSYAYTYDGDGNLLTQTVNGASTTFNYNSSDQQTCANWNSASSACNSGYGESYDNAGNLTNAEGQTLSYNSADQPTSMGGVSASFFGTGQDQETSLGSITLQNTQLGLTTASQNGGSDYYTLDNDGNPLGELSPSGDFYFITNPVNNTVLYVTDANGNVVRSNTYSPYGAQNTSGSGPDDIGWDGTFTAPNFNIYHFGAREYSPLTNRWTQPDDALSNVTSNNTISANSGLTLISDPTQDDPYSYAGDDPVNQTDSSGFSVGCTTDWCASHQKEIAKSGLGISFHLPSVKDLFCAAAGVAIGVVVLDAPPTAGLAAGAVGGLGCAATGSSKSSKKK